MVNTLAIVSLAISILAVVLLPFGFVPYILAIIALVWNIWSYNIKPLIITKKTS